MVRTKFSHRKTSGPGPKEDQPPAKSVKLSADNESEVTVSDKQPIDSAKFVLDLEKVQQATDLLPKIPKLIKKEPADSSEENLTIDTGSLKVGQVTIKVDTIRYILLQVYTVSVFRFSNNITVKLSNSLFVLNS